MSYKSPIEIIQTQMQTHVEDTIYQSVMKVGVTVDKDELLKALTYDRQQYQNGYADRDREIARCKDCVHRGKVEKCVLAAIAAEKGYPIFMLDNRGEWYCADGERK